jgi:hypothetical protein
VTEAGLVGAPASTVEELVRSRLAQQIGGPRGSLEAAVPTIVFVTLWSTRHDFALAVWVTVAVVAVLLVARLVQRQTPRFVLSSLVAVAIAAYFVHRTGRAQDAFLPGILYSIGVGVLTLLSVVTRWPLVGFIVGAAEDPEDPLAWHRDRGIVRLCQRLTWVLVGLYVVRVAIMLPLYLADRVAALSVAKVALGWPLYAVAIGVMGLILVRGRTPLSDATSAVTDPVSPTPAEG